MREMVRIRNIKGIFVLSVVGREICYQLRTVGRQLPDRKASVTENFDDTVEHGLGISSVAAPVMRSSTHKSLRIASLTSCVTSVDRFAISCRVLTA